jgi:deazaflavin-dependent oxidoreductase (nitroreductase family)
LLVQSLPIGFAVLETGGCVLGAASGKCPDVAGDSPASQPKFSGIDRMVPTNPTCHNEALRKFGMVAIKRKSMLWYFCRVPVYLYRWRFGWLFGHRFLLLTHTGRRTGLRRQTVLEVVEYRKQGPEVVVANGFGRDSDWLLNIEAGPGEEVTIGAQHFAASHRFLGEDEAARVIEGYEHRNRFIAPIVRRGFSWLLGWKYRGGESDRRRLVRQLPLLAFRPRAAQAQIPFPARRRA